MTAHLEIRESRKRKIAALVVLTLLLPAILGLFWGLVFPLLPKLYMLKMVVTVVVTSLIVFAIFVITKSLFSKKPALIINEKGITDNAIQSGVGFIPWSDIVGFKEATSFAKQKLLLFFVRNPIDYISRISGMKSGVLTSYHRQFGTPIVINLVNFEYDYKKLMKNIETVYCASKG
jgi:hypothetical protein